jgi:hypothetical protein
MYRINGVASATYLLWRNKDKANPNEAYIAPKIKDKPMRKNTYKSGFTR